MPTDWNTRRSDTPPGVLTRIAIALLDGAIWLVEFAVSLIERLRK